MNNTSRQYLFLRLLLAAAACAPAMAAADMALPLTYRAAIQAALVNRVELAIEQANVKRAGAGVEVAKGAFLPSVEVSSSVDRVKTYDTFPGVSLTAHYAGAVIPIDVQGVTPAYQLNSAVELKYNLYTGGADQARVTDARATDKAAQAQQAVAKRNVILDVTLAYWGLQKQQILYQTAQRHLDYAREEWHVAMEQHSKGRIARVELDTKALAVDTRETELRSTARGLTDAQRRYAHAMGLDAAGNVGAALLSDKPADVQINQLLGDIGLISTAEMKMAEAGLEGAKARVAEMAAEYKPTVELYARYTGRGRSEDSFGDAASGVHRANTTIGVRLKWSWFDGFRTDQRVAQALATSEQMQLKMEQTRRQLRHDLLEKQSRELDMRDQLQLARKQAELAQNQGLIAKKRWETNLISMMQYRTVQLSVDDAQSRERIAQAELLQAQVALRLAQVE